MLCVLFLAGNLLVARAFSQALTGESKGRYEVNVFAEGGPALNYRQNNGYSFQRPASQVALGGEIGVFPFRAQSEKRFQYAADIKPIFRGSFPYVNKLVTDTDLDNKQFKLEFPGYVIYGGEVTPVILKEVFRASKRVSPQAQVGCGILITAGNYPYDKTSQINFTPKAGFGVHFNVDPRHAIAAEVNAVHTSNGGIGASNPGVNLSVVFRVGYTWWR